MAGDQFNIRVSSWYKTNETTPGTPVNIINDLLSALTSGVGGVTSVHGGATAAQLQSSGVLIPGATNFLNNRVYNSSIPKAYLNWVLFDDQFKMVSSSSGAQQVGADTTFTPPIWRKVVIIVLASLWRKVVIIVLAQASACAVVKKRIVYLLYEPKI